MYKIFTLVAAIALVGVVSTFSEARLTGTNPTGASADVISWGKKNYEVIVDYLGGLIVSGNIIKTPVAAQTIVTNGTVDATGACGGLVRLTSAGSVTASNFSAISTANLGCVLYVVNTGPGGVITLQRNSNFAASGNVALGTGDALTVIQTATQWVTIATSDNIYP